MEGNKTEKKPLIFTDAEPFSRIHCKKALALVEGWTNFMKYYVFADNKTQQQKLKQTQQLATNIIKNHYRKIKRQKIINPSALAASALYLACQKTNVHVTQLMLKYLSGLTEVTIRRTVKLLKRELET